MYDVKPIAKVINDRKEILDDNWGNIISIIELNDDIPVESLLEIESFSHLEILFIFHQVPEEKIIYGARHPRNNQNWSKVGIFAQRGKNRPNKIGTTIVELIKKEGRRLYVRQLDAIDGTPIIDIKPVMREFLPNKEIKQPEWSSELMKNYW